MTKIYYRKCDTCGKGLNSGYYLGGEYACSDKCAFSDGYTKEQYSEDYDAGECYFTTFDCYEGEIYNADGEFLQNG